MLKTTIIVLVVLLMGGLVLSSEDKAVKNDNQPTTSAKTEQASFAEGCFWGSQVAFSKVPGVISTQVGYEGGTLDNPTYKDVCTDLTGHAETVRVTYDPTKVSFAELLDVFWSSHDPTTLNRQGPDFGTQYRSVIFYLNDEQKKIAEASIAEVDASKVFPGKIVTQVVPAGKFYSAEEYHQSYFEKHGMAATCHTGIAKVHTALAAKALSARLAAGKNKVACSPDDPNAACGTSHWKAMTDEEMRKKLTPEQYAIARQAGTERAFTGKYWNDHRDGVYHCAVCEQELFDSHTKFESGTGWPSFYAPIRKDVVAEKDDGTLGMKRTEVLCSRCGSHLGHVFDDGPAPTGLRYCMNSAVLDLHVGEKMPTTMASSK